MNTFFAVHEGGVNGYRMTSEQASKRWKDWVTDRRGQVIKVLDDGRHYQMSVSEGKVRWVNIPMETL